MSNLYEITNILTKRITNTFNNEHDMYIYEIELIDHNGISLYIRKIIKEAGGILISNIDNILYKNFNKYKITIINVNNLNDITYFNGVLNNNETKIINDNIYIKFIDNNLMECIYKINI